MTLPLTISNAVHGAFCGCPLCRGHSIEDVSMAYAMLHTEIVRAPADPQLQAIGFSPLDHWAGGHRPFSIAYAFAQSIDVDRFRTALQSALIANPEMGV